MKTLRLLLTCCIISLASTQLAAETIYISDDIRVWTRTGPSNAYKVKFKLAPGAKLEVIQTDADTSFIEVRDDRGRISWVNPELVTSNATVHHRLVAAEQNIESMKAEHAQTVSSLQRQINQMSPLEKVNSDLQSQLAQVQSDLEQARQKAQLYESGFKTDVFFGGAGVLLGGMLFGWIFSKVGGRPKNDGWS